MQSSVCGEWVSLDLDMQLNFPNNHDCSALCSDMNLDVVGLEF